MPEEKGQTVSLLTLPSEIRLAIWEAVISSSTKIASGLDATMQTSTASEEDHGHRYFASWCALMLTSSQIAAEMQDHMAKQFSQRRLTYLTWTVELEIFRGTGIKQASHRRFPCPPAHLRILRLETPLDGLEQPLAVARILNQIVSLVLRRGPSLDAGKSWDPVQQDNLRIREVHLAFYWHCSASRKRYGLAEEISRCFRRLHQGLVAEGAGHIETIRLINDYYEQAWPTLRGSSR